MRQTHTKWAKRQLLLHFPAVDIESDTPICMEYRVSDMEFEHEVLVMVNGIWEVALHPL